MSGWKAVLLAICVALGATIAAAQGPLGDQEQALRDRLTVVWQSMGQTGPSPGLLQEAEAILAEATRTYGENARQVLDPRMAVHQLRMALRRPHDPVAWLEGTLALAQQHFPGTHPGVIAIKGELSQHLFVLNPLRAQLLGQEALSDSETTHGADHPVTAALATNLASATIMAGRIGDAEQLFERAVTIFSKQAQQVPLSLLAHETLAALYLVDARYDEAITLARKAMTIGPAIFGPQEQFGLSARFLLAQGLIGQGSEQAETEARALLHEGLAIAARAGRDPSRLLMGPLGNAPFAGGNVLGLTLLKAALEETRRDPALPDRMTLQILTVLAETKVEDLSDQDLAQGVALAEAAFGTNSREALQFLLFRAQEGMSANPARARKALSAVLDAATAAGVGDIQQRAHWFLAILWAAEDPTGRFLTHARAAYELAEQQLAPGDLIRLSSMKTLADALAASGDLEAFERLVSEGLTLATTHLGLNHTLTNSFLISHATILAQSGQIDDSVALLRRALAYARDPNSRPPMPPEALLPVRLSLITMALAGGAADPELIAEAQSLAKDASRLLGDDDMLTIHATLMRLMFEMMGEDEALQPQARTEITLLIERLDRAQPDPTFLHVLLQQVRAYELAYDDPVAAIEAFDKAAEMADSIDLDMGGRDTQTIAMLLDEGGFSDQAASYYQRALDRLIDSADTGGAELLSFAHSVAHLALSRPGKLNLSDRLSPFQILQWPMERQAGSALRSAALRFSAKDPALAKELRTLQDLRARLADLDAQLVAAFDTGDDRDVVALQTSLAETRERLAAARAAVAAGNPDYAMIGGASPLTESQVAALLRPGEALLLLSPTQFGRNDEILPGAAVLVRWDGQTHSAPLDPYLVHSTGLQALRCQLSPDPALCGYDLAIDDTRGPNSPTRAAEPLEPETLDFRLDLAHDLYLDLIAPIEAGLQGVDHLLFVPGDETAATLPLQVLVVAPPDPTLAPEVALRSAHWLIRDMAITTLPTVSSLRTLRGNNSRSTAKRAFLGVGDPLVGEELPFDCAQLQMADLKRNAGPAAQEPLMTLGKGTAAALADLPRLRQLRRLPDTRCELERVRDHLGGGDLLLGAGATESAIKTRDAAGELASYRVLSFATHGLVAGEAGAAEPALVMTPPDSASLADDGLLTASEIAALSLDADMVLLSACNTAAGGQRNGARGEALSGLARAFFYAGARSLLVSHWPVNSDAAVRLTTNMFEALDEDPAAGSSQALRRAVLALLDDPVSGARELHPRHWAPFSLVGGGL